MAYCFFAWDDSLNVPRLSELYVLSCTLDDIQLHPSSFLAKQLHSTTVSDKGRIVIGGIVTTIARFLSIESHPEDRVSRSKRLDQVAFEIMNFCKVEAGRLYWIYPRDRLLLLPNVDRTTLLHWANLYWVPGDAEAVQFAPPLPPYSSLVR